MKRLARQLLVDPFELVHHATRAHDGDPLLGVARAVTHAGLGRLLGDRLVRKDPDVELAAALDVAGDGDTRRLDLPRGDEPARQRLQGVLAERDIGRALRKARHAALLLFAPFYFFRSEHRLGLLLRLLREPGVPLGQNFTLEDPAFDADGAVGGVGLGGAVLDVGAQRVQRHATLVVPLVARHLGAAETARAREADALGAELHGRLHGLLHGAAEGDAALELRRDVLGDELRVRLGLADLLDVEEDLVRREGL